ncbi:MAG: adenylate/guanylate cyclase domain-containing protein [Gammaproteobacteria bacterium]|nr:adenylate/guanylate cyclase domain-containing protein [Gammaproteobacteria bacterium]MDH5800314.1 adenylate/guanylate cyclase domain-containing protein [Gammaproteobacteria bacterium]
MTARLISEIDGQTQTFVCESGLTFGRDSHSDVTLSDPLASRNHAVLRQMRGNAYVLTDMGSTNGTFLNDRRISEPTVVKDGDTIRIGSSSFEFKKEHAEVVTSVDIPEKTVISKTVRVAEITVLISDIRNFTQLSESLPIETLTQVIGQWSREVAQVVADNHGTVDKFIGDCVYARWESKKASESVMSALRTANELNRICLRMNEQYTQLPHPIVVGVGINTGSAAVDFSQENTAIGDAVNIAFRLESASKDLGKDIVISQSSYQHLPGELCTQRAQSLMVKGKSEAVIASGLDFSDLPILLERDR